MAAATSLMATSSWLGAASDWPRHPHATCCHDSFAAFSLSFSSASSSSSSPVSVRSAARPEVRNDSASSAARSKPASSSSTVWVPHPQGGLHPGERLRARQALRAAATQESVTEEWTSAEPLNVKELMVKCLRDSVAECSRSLHLLGSAPDDIVVHDLRVAMRRLRNALQLFGPFLDLPDGVSRKALSCILRALGAVRDMDVMLETFGGLAERSKEQTLGPEEVREVEGVEKFMRKRQKKAMKDAVGCLKRKCSLRLFRRLRGWARAVDVHPKMSAVAALPALPAAPSFLAPGASRLLLHSAWHIPEIERVEPLPLVAEENRGKKMVEASFPTYHLQSCDEMHDLRKHMRELRYEMELLLPLFPPSGRFSKTVVSLQKLQGVLGDLQDLHVLLDFLAVRFDAGKMPAMVDAIASLHHQIWDQWVDERELINSSKGRRKLFSSFILKPDYKLQGRTLPS